MTSKTPKSMPIIQKLIVIGPLYVFVQKETIHIFNNDPEHNYNIKLQISLDSLFIVASRTTYATTYSFNKEIIKLIDSNDGCFKIKSLISNFDISQALIKIFDIGYSDSSTFHCSLRDGATFEYAGSILKIDQSIITMKNSLFLASNLIHTKESYGSIIKSNLQGLQSNKDNMVRDTELSDFCKIEDTITI